jgi:hypothetical protein
VIFPYLATLYAGSVALCRGGQHFSGASLAFGKVQGPKQ